METRGGEIGMSRAPRAPDEIFQDFTRDVQENFADDLVSIILYGSGATGEYVPGKSDLNFLIVLKDASVNSLRRFMKSSLRWRKRRVNTPLFMTESYIRSSLDSYPLEFLDMRANYRLVQGKDVLKDLSFRPDDIRVQCERELKGKALHLHQAYLESGGKSGLLRRIISSSITTFTSIFEGLLFLKAIDIPKTKKEIIERVATEFGMDRDLFLKLLAIRKGVIKVSGDEIVGLFRKYSSEIDALSDAVDRLILKQEEGT
jgi:predicted nucleotidyltransferase